MRHRPQSVQWRRLDRPARRAFFAFRHAALGRCSVRGEGEGGGEEVHDEQIFLCNNYNLAARHSQVWGSLLTSLRLSARYLISSCLFDTQPGWKLKAERLIEDWRSEYGAKRLVRVVFTESESKKCYLFNHIPNGKELLRALASTQQSPKFSNAEPIWEHFL